MIITIVPLTFSQFVLKKQHECKKPLSYYLQVGLNICIDK
jgi:hypothetical protein